MHVCIQVKESCLTIFDAYYLGMPPPKSQVCEGIKLLDAVNHLPATISPFLQSASCPPTAMFTEQVFRVKKLVGRRGAPELELLAVVIVLFAPILHESLTNSNFVTNTI